MQDESNPVSNAPRSPSFRGVTHGTPSRLSCRAEQTQRPQIRSIGACHLGRSLAQWTVRSRIGISPWPGNISHGATIQRKVTFISGLTGPLVIFRDDSTPVAIFLGIRFFPLPRVCLKGGVFGIDTK